MPVGEEEGGEEGEGSGKQQLVRLGEKREEREQMASRSPAGQGLHGIRITAPWKTA